MITAVVGSRITKGCFSVSQVAKDKLFEVGKAIIYNSCQEDEKSSTYTSGIINKSKVKGSIV